MSTKSSRPQTEKVRYFRPRNWRQWQTYKSPNPKYIRNEVALIHDHEYAQLTSDQRGLLHGIWLLCARTGKALPWDCGYIAAALHLNYQGIARQLPILERNGFIELCEKEWKSFPIYTETETETETESKKRLSKDNRTDPAVRLWSVGLEYLVSNSGRSETQCRSFIGKMKKVHSESDILSAITAAQLEHAAEPIAFVQKTLSARQKKNGGKPEGFV